MATTTTSADPTLSPAIPSTTPVAGNSQTAPSITVNTNNILNIQNAAAAIQFTPGPSSATFHNEMGVFTVDDDQGRVDGILPGNAGYLAGVMKRSQVIGGNIDEAKTVMNSRQLSFAQGAKLGSYLVQDGTTAEIKNDLLAGQAPSHPVFFQTGNSDGIDHLRIVASGGKYTFTWEDTLGNSATKPNDFDYNDLLVDAKLASSPAPPGTKLAGSQPAIDLRDISGVQSASVTVGGSASYDNLVGFYTVDDANGKIGNLSPNDPGYARAAIDRRIASYAKDSGTTNTQITAGSIFAPYLIANGSIQDFLAKNPTNQSTANLPLAYFGYIGANPDRIEHIRLLGDNQFAFEDALGGGDRDFNDATIQLKIGT
jgi:Domain of unknown function (DUF4114)